MKLHLLEKIGGGLLLLLALLAVLIKLTVDRAYLVAPFMLPACVILLIGSLRRQSTEKHGKNR